MKTKFNGILTLLLAFVVQISFAQDRTISGTVSDENGPLPGVSVLKKGTTQGTETDFDGKYTIKAKTGDVLVFSFVGMENTEKTIGTSNSVNVTMQAGNVLEEVVVTALGVEKKKDDDLSSSTTIKTEAITRSGETGVIQALSGKTSGVTITRNSGDAGTGAYIQIRGQNTILGDASPLIILDGVPISNSNIGDGTDGVSQQSRLNDISQEDIKSMTVLKGASAAAIYGTSAANGVIVIQTKSGSRNSSWKVDLKASVSFDEVNVEHKKQNTFGQGYPTHWLGQDFNPLSGVWRANVGTSWGDKIDLRTGNADEVNTSGKYFEGDNGEKIYPITARNSRETFNESNREQVFRNAISNDISLSVSKGGENSSTFFSFGRLSQEGVIKASNYVRTNFRLNHNLDLTKDLKARINTGYTNSRSNRIQKGSNLSGLYLGYLRTSPDFDNSVYKGTYVDSEGNKFPNSQRSYRRYLGDRPPAYNNPGWTINEQRNPSIVDRFIISPEINWTIKDNLVLTARYGLDFYQDQRTTYFPINSSGDFGSGFLRKRSYAEKNQQYNIFLNGNNTINDNFKIDWTVGYSLEQLNYDVHRASSSNLLNPTNKEIIDNAISADNGGGYYTKIDKKNGAYGVLNFNLYNQLFLEFTGRYQRSASLPEQGFFFPSASLGWKFSELIGKDSFLSFGKIRLSYGEVGIEPSLYRNQDIYTASTSGNSGWGDLIDGGNYGGTFIRSTTKGNPNLTIERIKEYEIGTDLRFLDNKLTLGFTYYNRVTEDALLPIDQPASTGYTRIYKNAAEISNKGIEADLSYKIFNTEDLKWSVSANFSKNKNIVEKLPDVGRYILNGFTSTSSAVVEGSPFGAIYGGKILRDDSGKPVLDDNGFIQAGGQGVIGDPNPDWKGGLGTIVSYKGITLSAQLETSQGNDMWAGTEGVLYYFGIHPTTANISKHSSDLKTYGGNTIPANTPFRGNVHDFGGGPVALDVDWYTDNGGGFGNIGEQFVKDASWTRIREISLGYSLPSKILGKTFKYIDFTVTGRNLFLWTDFEGVDPDLNLTGASKGRGLDYFTNPGTKSYLFTVKFGF